MFKSIFLTFIIVFLAELGDKTQLSTMIMASRSNSVWCIFIGSSIALVLSSLIGVFIGCYINKIIPMSYIHILSGITFIVIGFLLLLDII